MENIPSFLFEEIINEEELCYILKNIGKKKINYFDKEGNVKKSMVSFHDCVVIVR